MSDDDNTNTEEVEFQRSHPMEQVFDIEEGSTIYPRTVTKTSLVKTEQYDDKDDEIDGQFQHVYDLAIDAFNDQQEEAEIVDPKYRARNAEVAVQYLNTALAAATQKSNLKQTKEKLGLAREKAGDKIGQQNNFIMDRNDILRMMEEDDKVGEIIDQYPTAEDADVED